MILNLFFICASAEVNITKVDPPFWWAGMVNTELQIMFYGKDIAYYRPSLTYNGVKILSTVALESNNYLLVYLSLAGAKPGTLKFTFKRDSDKFIFNYDLKKRDENSQNIQGFDSSDVLYLIMPDRFANGNITNDDIPMKTGYTVDRSDMNVRHGGDLKGIEDHLDYIQELGVTTLWLNPVLENDVYGGSYHGYATTDFYKIDARFGTNEDYINLCNNIHNRDLKIIMDIIFNHCGGDHAWFYDTPSADWFSTKDTFYHTNHAIEVRFSPYSTDSDKTQFETGNFAGDKPDLNQKNPHVARYLIQCSIFWIELAHINGIRQDAYPYADPNMMREWCKEIHNEYPNFNEVGEVWMENQAAASFWQKGNKLSDVDPELKSVMDFVFMKTMRTAVYNDNSLGDLYFQLNFDYFFPNISNVIRFLDNHDADRFLRYEPSDLKIYKQGIVLLLTLPGTPQIYYGTEVLMFGTKNRGDGYVRQDFPGGWLGDEKNYFVPEGRTALQNEAFDFCKKVLRFRRNNKLISNGKMKHYLIQNGIYIYFRYLDGKKFVVVLNGMAYESEVKYSQFKEAFGDDDYWTDLLTGKEYDVDDEELVLSAKEVLILQPNSNKASLAKRPSIH
ncbi:glycoside hydrolase family protein [Tritrichomonas foetus]|uniref:Glycoside hydrolase family protein n=1 Tax=Tritrichomonas foetus TaxID=1144522 RepID=A0A1J4J361_9EUKA|nr:glycoside hydrolase family protein [Tritrichomonas foetus]|eukprot:OHS93888.1 glycoside hydrolase family protein [Tritrichomonas foetus]